MCEHGCFSVIYKLMARSIFKYLKEYQRLPRWNPVIRQILIFERVMRSAPRFSI